MSRHLDAARSFLEQLEARDRREGAILAGEFSDIKARSVAWKTEGVCSTKAGSQRGNVKKNRYKDVVPCESVGFLRELEPLAHPLNGSAVAVLTPCPRALAKAPCLPKTCVGTLWLSAAQGANPCQCTVSLLTFTWEAVNNLAPLHISHPLADDETRVILSLLQEEGHGDYINANFIRGTDGSQAYIATQGPLPHTLLDFWRLVWEFGVKVILMACQEIENGRKKCERYWAQERELLKTGPFCITLESRTVHQLQYTSWPDHGVPSNPDHMLTMVEEARRLQGFGPGPLCIHCSAGCGRTGVLCATDYVRQLLLTQTIPPNFSLFDVVLEMRKQRPAAVQTEEQYKFLYHTVAQLFSRALRKTSPEYQNLKENCAPVSRDAFSVRTSPAPPATPRPSGGVLRSISAPGPATLGMTDTYAVVQKRGAPASAGPGTRAPGGAETPLYSQVTPRAQRPVAPADDARRTSPTHVPVDQNPPGPDAYEEVTDGAQTGRLGFNLRIGRPKGPRDPPAEWTRV